MGMGLDEAIFTLPIKSSLTVSLKGVFSPSFIGQLKKKTACRSQTVSLGHIYEKTQILPSFQADWMGFESQLKDPSSWIAQTCVFKLL